MAELSDEETLKGICATISSDYGGVNILVNNAALGGVFPTDDYPEAQWHKTIAVNLEVAPEIWTDR